VVALQHFVETPDDAGERALPHADARAEVERLGAGLSRALLAASPEAVGSLAARAAEAGAAAARRRARVGERPALDPDANAAVVVAVAEYRGACAARLTNEVERNRVLAVGNAAGVAGLAVAGVLSMAGVPVMAIPVAVAIVGAAVGPATACVIALNRTSLAVRRVLVARADWSAALDRAGLPTMGALQARRVAVAGWERGVAEAEAAEQAAIPHLRAWHRMAGPGVPPGDAEALVDQVARLRSAQLHLLSLLIEDRMRAVPPVVAAPDPEIAAADDATATVVQPLTPAAEVVGRTPSPRAPVGPRRPEPLAGWLHDALDRIRGRRATL